MTEHITVDEVINKVKCDYFEPFDDFDEYFWVQGGCIVDAFMGKPINDIDIFFINRDIREKALDHMLNKGFTYIKENPTHYKLTNNVLKYDILSHERYISPKSNIKLADYQHCAVAIDSNGKFYAHDNFFDRLKDRKLLPVSSDNFNPVHIWPIHAIRRILKLLKKGWTIDQETLITVLERSVYLQDHIINPNPKVRKKK